MLLPVRQETSSCRHVPVFAGAMSEHAVLHSHIDVDQIEEILARTVGSVKGAAGLLLWCVVQYWDVRAELGGQSWLVWAALAWVVLVVSSRLCMWANRRLLRGRGPWVLDPATDVVLITGAASGLGLVLAALFSLEGFKTVIFDLHEPQIAIAGSVYRRVDVSDEAAVAQAVDETIDAPTVLVNCAGTVAGSLGATARVQPAPVARVVNTNLLGPIWAVRAVLNRGVPLKMVVGISSSTALVGPARAGVYAASKAGLRVFMESLRHELPQTRVLCVTPGQLDTEMFRDVETPSKFWAPVCHTPDLAERIYRAVRDGDQGELRMPTYARLLPYVLLLPQSLVDILRWMNGIDRSVPAGNDGADAVEVAGAQMKKTM